MSWIVFFVFLFSGLRFVRFSFMDHKMIGRLCLLSWRLVLVPSFWDGYKLLINFINFSVSVDACYVASVVSDSLWPLDGCPPGFSVQGILQARKLEWVTMTSSRGSSQPRDRTLVSLHLLHWQGGTLPLALPGKTKFFVFLVFLLE